MSHDQLTYLENAMEDYFDKVEEYTDTQPYSDELLCLRSCGHHGTRLKNAFYNILKELNDELEGEKA